MMPRASNFESVERQRIGATAMRAVSHTASTGMDAGLAKRVYSPPDLAVLGSLATLTLGSPGACPEEMGGSVAGTITEDCP